MVLLLTSALTFLFAPSARALARVGLNTTASTDSTGKTGSSISDIPSAGTSSAASSLDPAAAASSDESLLLEVYINGHSTQKIGEFVMRHGVLLTRPQELIDLGIRIPDSLN